MCELHSLYNEREFDHGRVGNNLKRFTLQSIKCIRLFFSSICSPQATNFHLFQQGFEPITALVYTLDFFLLCLNVSFHCKLYRPIIKVFEISRSRSKIRWKSSRCDSTKRLFYVFFKTLLYFHEYALVFRVGVYGVNKLSFYSLCLFRKAFILDIEAPSRWDEATSSK